MTNVTVLRLARNGKEWTDVFSAFNSGTYNNQFMIIDYNKFEQWLHYKSYSAAEGDCEIN